MTCNRSTKAAAKSALESGGVPTTTSSSASTVGSTLWKKRAAGAAVVGISAVAIRLIATRNSPKLGQLALGVAVKQDRRANQRYRQAADTLAWALTNAGTNRLKLLKEAERLAQQSIKQFRTAGRVAGLATRLGGIPSGRLAQTMNTPRAAKGARRAYMLLGLIKQARGGG
jgi:hypothetical protein